MAKPRTKLIKDIFSYLREINEADNLFWCHVHQHLPHRLVLQPGPEVPQAVDDGRHRHGDHTLLRPEPPELALVIYFVKPLAHVFENVLQSGHVSSFNESTICSLCFWEILDDSLLP